ncbi:MAG: hypothetical protein ACTSPI_00215 [Candidatus Heimdallarchaeaceae archaeon]
MADTPQWIGFDPLSVLLGGQEKKLELVGKGLKALADSIQAVNKLNEIVNNILESSNDKLQDALEENYITGIVNEGIDSLKNAVEDIKGTGVYWLNLNTATPPMYMYGQSFKEQSIQREITNIRIDISNFEKEQFGTKDLIILRNEIKRLKEELTGVRKTGGGNYRYYKTFSQSLSDQYDFSRPKFSEDAGVAALFVMFGGTSFNDFMTKYDKLSNLLGTISNMASPEVRPSLINLRANYVASDAVDSKYIELSHYWEEGVKNYKDKGGDIGIAPHLVLVKINTETEAEPEMIPLDLASEFSKMSSVLGQDQETLIYKDFEYEAGNFRYALVFKPDMLSFRFPTVTERYFFTRNGQVFFKGIELRNYQEDPAQKYDPSESNSADGNVMLYWDYPKTTSFLGRVFKDTTVFGNEILLYKHKLTKSNRTKDLLVSLIQNTPPKIDKNIEVVSINALGGLSKFYPDKVENIQEAKDHKTNKKSDPIHGYDYAVSLNYHLSQNIQVGPQIGTVKGTLIWGKSYPFPVVAAVPTKDGALNEEVLKAMDADDAQIIRDRVVELQAQKDAVFLELEKFAGDNTYDIDRDRKENRITELSLSLFNTEEELYQSHTKLEEEKIIYNSQLIEENALKKEDPDSDSRIRIKEQLSLTQEAIDTLKENIISLPEEIEDTRDEIKDIRDEIKDLTKINKSNYYQKTLNDLETKHGRALLLINPPLSNIAGMTMPIEHHSYPLSIPPDWNTLPHLTMMIPKITQFLDFAVAWVDSLANSIKDAIAFTDELKDVIKAELSGVSDTITDLIKTLSDVIELLSSLSFGAWVLPVVLPRGGIKLVDKYLAMSLTGKLTDYSTNLLTGPPPYGADDYVGGFVLLGGTAGEFSDTIKGVVGDLANYLLSEEQVQEVEQFDNEDLTEESFPEPVISAEEIGDPTILTTPTYTQEELNNIMAQQAFCTEAINALNEGNISTVAACLANIFASDFFTDATLRDQFINVGNAMDPDLYEDSGYKDFVEALRTLNSILMAQAARKLQLSGFVWEDEAFYMNLGQAIAEYLMFLADLVSDLSNGTLPTVLIDPFAVVTDVDVLVPHDTYQIGYNVATYADIDPLYYDTRLLYSQVHNDELEVLDLIGEFEVVLQDESIYETVAGNLEYEIFQFDEIFSL